MVHLERRGTRTHLVIWVPMEQMDPMGEMGELVYLDWMLVLHIYSCQVYNCQFHVFTKQAIQS